MIITLHCGGLPFNGTTIKERSLGGSESAAYYMAKELAAKGNKVTIFTNAKEDSISDNVRYVPAGIVSEQYPLGKVFHFYAENTPCDVMIIQRHPQAFKFNWASKINLLWLHDLALYRHRHMIEDAMWNIDGVLTVSEWHKKQVCEVYGLNPKVVYAITNGVDLELFEGEHEGKMKKLLIGEDILQQGETVENFNKRKQIKLLYTSRPERGLENLVKPNGIMERLLKIDSKYHLYVCGYDNTLPNTRSFYEMLWNRIEELPNCTNLSSLTKQELADVMRQVDLHVYPSTFEETSCITAMECMAAGLPMIACNVGAIPETTYDSGTWLLPLINNEVSIDEFVRVLQGTKQYAKFKKQQLEKAPHYSWLNASDKLTKVIRKCFAAARTSKTAIFRELLNNSDYYAAMRLEYITRPTNMMLSLYKEIDECYAFTKEEIFDKHYEAYYEYEKERGVIYGPQDISDNHRYIHVANLISSLNDDSVVLDYGCAHGHYTNNLAKTFPNKRFIGIDICASNIEIAKKWAKDENISNCEFFVGRVSKGVLVNIDGNHPITTLRADAIIVAEVLEHVSDPDEHINTLQNFAKENALMLITTPYGPWEAQGYKEQWPWRAHVHHFEREDLANLWGHNKEFKVLSIPGGHGKFGNALGSYVTTWLNENKDSGSIDYKRKLELIAPTQTISCCMIVKDSQNSIRRCLESVMPFVDELIIRFDTLSKDLNDDLYTTTYGGAEVEFIVDQYMTDNWPEKSYIMFNAKTPLLVGFDKARNETIEKANGDWILWIDSDEYLYNGQNLIKYLRNNQYNGYGIPQHHFSMEPLGIQKTDLPVRVFRNGKGIKFFGKVHEHPEKILNKGVGHVNIINDVSILHDGYKNEITRRNRFSRNIDLLVKDRKENPKRLLGKFLWLRDLAQMSEWELKDNGGVINATMHKRANEGITLWRELLDNGDIRIVIDSLIYYSVLSRIKGNGFTMDVRLDTNKFGESDATKIVPITAYFNSKEDAKKLMGMVFNERTKTYEEKYQ